MKRSLILVALFAGVAYAAERPLTYPVMDTGQIKCYDNRGEIAAPKPAQPFPRGRGPQGDVIRIFNYVRLVRGGLN